MYSTKIKELLADKLLINSDNIDGDDLIAEDLGADSLDVVEIVMGLESEFEINISDEDAKKLLTVNNIINYINERVPKKGS
jgi:acyl carrier protein